ncbi:MAG TPA: glycine oxidase ThiO [Terriglobales bacterium]|nr:glycine oxidase ThiO [Terriglobales bacterium]
MKTWDVIIAGGGIIGLSLAIALRKRGAKVLLVERGEPGREASHAAGGMLVDCSLETPPALQPLAVASARMYPEFVHELEDESGEEVDLRDQGALVFPPPEHVHERPGFTVESLLPAPLAKLEPALAESKRPAFYLKERSVDPRALTAAALKAAKHRSVDIVSGSAVTEALLIDGRVAGVASDKTSYAAPVFVNCAGAWAGQILPLRFPTRPVKGQMLCLVAERGLLGHVLRSPDVYVIPRSDGRILVGATVEEAGFDKRTDPETIQRLHQAAIRLVPALRDARLHDAWAGLRPGSPDNLPILGATPTPGYFAATGHFRDGILLAPVTAHVMAQVITGVKPEYDLRAFSPDRFPS